ncbi:MAG: sugar phosphate isomerase/epimerase family protein [Promethearchaeota archaeon]|jgi:sugar phosphate isomerase/epimerase
MELGISSLGYIIEYGLAKDYKNLTDLFIKASEDCLRFAENNSIKIVELVLDPPEFIQGETRQKFINLINSYSVKKQIHGPFIDVNLCTHNDIIANASVKCYVETVKICNEIKSKVLTIHPGLGNFLINSIMEFNKVQLAKSINRLLNSTNDLGHIICLENMPKNCNIMLDENDIEETFLKINREDIYLTYDTSHFFTSDGNVRVLWNKLHKIIKNIHIVDNFTKNSDTHPPLGTGKVNFSEIFEVLESYNYQGPLIIELSSAKDLPQSIAFINKFL